MRQLAPILSLLTLPLIAHAQDPELLVVVGTDTLRNHVVRDSIFEDGELDRVRITRRPDTLKTTGVVGDTMRVELWAENWPEVVGYKISVLTFNKESADYELGDFYDVSGLPTTTGGLVFNGSYEIGQTSLGDSRGEGSGRLGTLVAVWESSGETGFEFESAEYTILDSSNSFVSHGLEAEMIITLEVDPLEISVTADLDNNGLISFDDFLSFANRFGARRGEPNYDELADFNGDGSIDFNDFLLLAGDFGGPPVIYRTISRS